VSVGHEEALDEFIEALEADDPQHLYDNAPCGYLSTDPDGVILKANQTFLTLSGYARAELVGRRRFAELLTKGGQIYHETHYAPMLRLQGAAREIALELVTRDGERLPVLVNAVLERDLHGQPRVIRAAVFAAAVRRQYEQDLLAAKEQAEASEGRAVALARTLQATLIPPTPPRIPTLDLATGYRPAGDGTLVGGDFYDVFQLDQGDWVITLGDVCGKGAEAAVITALARYTLRAAAVEDGRPSAALRTLNQVMLGHETERFCTVAFLRLRRDGRTIQCSLGLGGHPRPLLHRADGSVVEVGAPGSLVGVLEDPDFEDASVDLQPGDALLLFTDGVIEARRGRDLYGSARLVELVRSPRGTADDLVMAVMEDVLAFQGGVAVDDIAVVALQVPG
jgi:sigma-B regulation protein RsbU (phosphoserine phosphatase)